MSAGDASSSVSEQPRYAPVRPAPYWPAWTILGLAVAAIAYLQIVRFIDKGWSNALSGLAILLSVVLLGIWTAFFSPFSRATRWWCIAAALAVVVLLAAVLRIDGFDGNLRPLIAWRWSPVPEAELATTEMETDENSATVEWRPTPHDYLGFLGRNRDGFVPNVSLATDWQTRPPRLLWKRPIGGGYSAFAIVGDAAVTMEQRGPRELVTCYDVPTGELRWFHAIAARHHDAIGGDGPSGTPTLHEGRVYALGGTGVLRCLDATNGMLIWQRDVLADVGTTYEADRVGLPWGRSASPLVVDDLVIVPGGGPRAGQRASLVAYKLADGEIAWKGGASQVSYSSPSIATFGGVRQVVIVNEDTITSHDPATGETLWSTPWNGSSNAAASASQTVQVANDTFFVSKGYSMGGGALFSVTRADDGKWSVNKLWHNRRVLLTKQNNVIIADGFVFGLSDGELQCVDLETGQRQWTGDEYGHGQLLRVGDVLLVLGEWGQLAAVALDPMAFRELARIQAIDGKTWNNPALSGNRLLVRNSQEAACYELHLVPE